MKFSAITEWREAAHATTAVRCSTVLSDEPASLVGTNLAPNAVELQHFSPSDSSTTWPCRGSRSGG